MIASRPSTADTSAASASIGSSPTTLPSAVPPASRRAVSVVVSSSSGALLAVLADRLDVDVVHAERRVAHQLAAGEGAHRGLDAGGGVLERQQHVVDDRVVELLVQREHLAGVLPGSAPARPAGPRRRNRSWFASLPLRGYGRDRRRRPPRAARSRTTRGRGRCASAGTARCAGTGGPPCGRRPPRPRARGAAGAKLRSLPWLHRLCVPGTRSGLAVRNSAHRPHGWSSIGTTSSCSSCHSSARRFSVKLALTPTCCSSPSV